MKMVDGTPWLNVINDKSREENIEILMKVCDAVAFAHSRNIIHRDLKPENVMWERSVRLLVMDWGLAIDLTVDQNFGMSGTPAFMAPEMAAHQVEDIGRCSDIYILGGAIPLPNHCWQATAWRFKTVRECLCGRWITGSSRRISKIRCWILRCMQWRRIREIATKRLLSSRKQFENTYATQKASPDASSRGIA